MPYRISYKREGYRNWSKYRRSFKNKSGAQESAKQIKTLERGTKVRVYHVKKR